MILFKRIFLNCVALVWENKSISVSVLQRVGLGVYMQCGRVVAETGVCRYDVEGVNEPPGIQRVLCVRCKWKKSRVEAGGLAAAWLVWVAECWRS
ncbi:hypothetical protein E2C01_008685 [Portunus trituberculatus]|uniref:Uncharacterized protein n=1 Tax=Portunus trituberculatus TaxID=210409 RepID=A0A5B7D3Q5_PORTR|nr:hypothetical protein [Portunus trituberculatus]